MTDLVIIYHISMVLAVLTVLGDGVLTAIERSIPMRTQVYENLRLLIVRGTLPPRSPLSEKDLSEQLGVSRTPVREALLRLGDEGLVEIYPQVGTFVSSIRTREVFDSQFVREALEVAAVEKAARTIVPADVKRLRKIIELQRFHEKAAEADAFFAADEKLHEEIFSIAGHAAAWSVVVAAKQQLDRVRYLAIRRPRKLKSVVEEHAAIVAALTAKDADGAVAAMRLHVRGVFATLEALISDNRDFFAIDGERPNRRAPSSSTTKTSQEET